MFFFMSNPTNIVYHSLFTWQWLLLVFIGSEMESFMSTKVFSLMRQPLSSMFRIKDTDGAQLKANENEQKCGSNGIYSLFIHIFPLHFGT